MGLPAVAAPTLDCPHCFFVSVGMLVGAVRTAALRRTLPPRSETLAVILAASAFCTITLKADFFVFNLFSVSQISYRFVINRFPLRQLFFSNALIMGTFRLLGTIREEQLIEIMRRPELDKREVGQGGFLLHQETRLHKK